MDEYGEDVDGARLTLSRKDLQLDAFAASPVTIRPDAWDDSGGGNALYRFLFEVVVASILAALFPVSDRSVQVCSIDPGPAEAPRPNGR
jgi:hypothetical protein